MKFFIFTLYAQIVVIILTILLGIKSNSKILRPIKNITQISKKISGNNLSLRINVKGVHDELRELAETINNMMDRIEVSYNQQKQFVSDASHELRTPIAVLQGYANLLDRWGKNDAQILQESITAIKNESNNMKELIEKLLFLARNDMNKMALNKENFDLSKLLQEIVKDTRLINTTHQIISNIQENIYTISDKNSLKQAIRILIENAVKYTPADSSITISLSQSDDSIIIGIKDTGIGISNQDLNKIFDRFYRSDKSRNKNFGGHGLGLSIAKIIILSHGGKITVRSKLETGTEFLIFLDRI